MEKYNCLAKNRFIHKNYTIVPFRKQDIYKIKEWRNSQIDVLRQKEILTDEMQERYYYSVIEPTYLEAFPKQILLSFLYNDICIGYGGLVHISWEDKRAEISFLVDTERAKQEEIYTKDFTHFLLLIKQLAFNELELNRLFLETYDIREKHINIIEESGFRLEGRMRQHIIIENEMVDSLIHGLLKTEYDQR